MTNQFPLARSPGAIVLVDDVSTMIDSLNLSLPDEWNIKSFIQIPEFMEYLHDQKAMLKQMDAFFYGAVDRYRKTGKVLVEVLRFWNTFPERYSIPQVVVVDYNMPQMNGLDVLNECLIIGSGRVLLTGMANEKTVMQAFNEGRMDRYIPKQTPKLGMQIANVVNELMNNFAIKRSRAWNPWFMSLTPEQMLILDDPVLAKHLSEFATGEFEYIAVGDPFGVLALGAKGNLKWLQIERTSTLDEAADLAVKLGTKSNDAAAIRSGKAISDARLIASLNLTNKPTLSPVVFSATSPHDHDTLMGASFDVNTAGSPSPDMCFAAWLSRQPGRD